MRRLLTSTIVIVFIVCIFLSITQNPLLAKDQPAKHLVPANKKLSQKMVKDLYKRGRREVYSGKDLDTIGMPVGGIAAGQLYLRGDGTLGLWQIFNKHIFTATMP